MVSVQIGAGNFPVDSVIPAWLIFTYMWFKTRVGICSVTDPSEILVSKGNKSDIWFIWASHKVCPKMSMRGLFGRSASISSPATHLAMFTNNSTVNEAIAECMAKLEAAIRAKSDICDLSQSGDAQAWGKAWTQIQWPR
jgi:hypothetical protein